MRKILFTLLPAFLIAFGAQAQKTFKLTSPDGTLSATISVGNEITYDLSLDGKQILSPSKVAMALSGGEVWGEKPSLKGSPKKTSVKQTIQSPIYRTAQIQDEYNQMTFQFKKDWSLEFRAYNGGLAYRFVSTRKSPYQVKSETVDYSFTGNYQTFTPYVRDGKDGDYQVQFYNSFENFYTETPLASLNTKRLAFLPLYVDAGGAKVCLTEVNLEGYPGLYLKGTGSNSLEGMNAPYPKTWKQGGHNMLQLEVQSSEDYIAKVEGPKSFPWRIAIVGRQDKDIAASTLSYQLAEASRLSDISWIKPGKVAWDWWNDWNISGVDFRAGINTQTYKYYIDFASQKGIEYVILDEGWAVNLKADLMQVIDEIDLQEIVNYGKQKNVGIILWAGFYAFDRDMENVCKHYSDMGVKGFKIDFMNRDDQIVTEFMYRAAATCAKYHLMADFHGTYKPSGLNRTYPNVINFEGVNGLEQMKWSTKDLDQMRYDCTIPFTRQVSGPMDYTQGAMINAIKANYYPANSEPMSQGTRCHQLGLYVVLESPLNMLCDSPTNYLKETECTDFIADIPTTWDETVILDGKIGDYVVVARRSGNDWYIGGITNWDARDLKIDTSFLGGQSYKLSLFKDGVNADRKASDYKLTQSTYQGSSMNIHLAPGGGFAMKLSK